VRESKERQGKGKHAHRETERAETTKLKENRVTLRVIGIKQEEEEEEETCLLCSPLSYPRSKATHITRAPRFLSLLFSLLWFSVQSV